MTDPRLVEFFPSADHNVVLPSGAPAVSKYLFEVYMQGAAAPFTTTDMGKPAPQADGVVRFDFSSQVASWPLPGGVYESRVAAAGPNGTSRSGVSNPFVLSSGTGCTFSVSPTSVSVTSGGGSWVISVSAGSGCGWTASSAVSWITATPASGSGNGTTTITVGANPATTSRTGTVTVAGKTVTVTQAPAACTYAVSPTGFAPGNTGGTFTVTVANSSACGWNASSAASWITVSPATGSGNGSVTLTVAANTSTSSRTGTVTVAGQAVTVTQSAAASCTFGVSPTTAPVPAAGQVVPISVTTQSGCAFSASSGVSWATLSPTTGTGNSTINATVAANTSTSTRTGTLTIAGQQVAITQAAATGGGSGTGDGLRGEYFDNLDFTAPVGTRVDSAVDFDWGSGAPLPAMGVDTYSARWTGKVQAQFTETYTFYTVSDDGVRLWVNGQLLIDNWTDHAPVENSRSVSLAAGQSYDIKLEFYENGGGALARLLWSSPSTPKAVVPRSQLYSSAGTTGGGGGGGGTTGTGDGLRGEYFDNWDFTAPVSSRVDATVDFDWGAGAPQATMGPDAFSVRWTGKVQAQFSETYTFYTVSDDGVRLWVNGQLLIDNWTNHAPTENSGTVTLIAGQSYDIKLEFFENGGGAVSRLLWSGPSTPKAVVPRSQLYSSAGTTGGGGGTTGTGDGLRGEYFDNWDFTAPVSTRVDATVDFDWMGNAPQAGMGADTFSVRWTGKVQAQFSEAYTFYTVSDDGVRLWVNGQLLVDNWTNHAPIENSGTMTLTAGQSYDVKLEFYEDGGGAVARLLWSSPSTAKAIVPRAQLYSSAVTSGGGGGGTTATGDGLRADYYDNWDFTAPVASRVDTAVDFDWGTGAPQASMGADTFSVRWTGRVQAPTTGTYTFYTVSDDGVRLWVNGQLLIDNWTNHGPTEDSGTITLTAGQTYSIKLEFFENGGGAVARLLWSGPSVPKQVIPTARLFSTP